MQNLETLISVGFQKVGNWTVTVNQTLIITSPEVLDTSWSVVQNRCPALYAFVVDGEVKYLGKTAMPLRQRFYGYLNPGSGQKTNLRVNEKICKSLANGTDVEIWVFFGADQLQWLDYPINVPAAIEDALISDLQPEWNIAGIRNRKISETKEREIDVSPLPDEQVTTKCDWVSPTTCPFTITLGPTYWRHGFLNTGVNASQHLGQNGSDILICLENDYPVQSIIDRTANQNGSVRIQANTRPIANWFQANFRPGDTVNGEVVNPQMIRLRLGA